MTFAITAKGKRLRICALLLGLASQAFAQEPFGSTSSSPGPNIGESPAGSSSAGPGTGIGITSGVVGGPPSVPLTPCARLSGAAREECLRKAPPGPSPSTSGATSQGMGTGMGAGTGAGSSGANASSGVNSSGATGAAGAPSR